MQGNSKLTMLMGIALAMGGCAADVGDVGTSEEAITAGTPDVDNEYPEHAFVSAVFPDGSFFPACSGVLVEPDKVLTVAHCELEFPYAYRNATGSLPSSDYVWGVIFAQSLEFGPNPTMPSTPFADHERHYFGELHSRPGYRLGTAGQRQETGADNRDFAVMVLDQPVEGIEPAILPPVGFLDRRNVNALEDAEFTLVGHGFDFTAPFPFPGTRRIGRAGFDYLDDRGTLTLQTSLAQGYNSACYGDSGGPIYWGDTHILVALNDEIEPSCFGDWNQAQRVDIESARDFFGQYGVTYPGDGR